MFQLIIKNPEGDAMELVSSDDEAVCEGALLGAQALLNVLADAYEVAEGYSLSIRHRGLGPLEEDQEARRFDSPL